MANYIRNIHQDIDGNMWFGTRYGGINRFDGSSVVTFSQSDHTIGNDEVCAAYADRKGNIWFSSKGYGIYKYDGDVLRNYSKEKGLSVSAVQTIYEDKDGRIWAGGGGGLYRLDGNKFINITKNGPWG